MIRTDRGSGMEVRAGLARWIVAAACLLSCLGAASSAAAHARRPYTLPPTVAPLARPAPAHGRLRAMVASAAGTPAVTTVAVGSLPTGVAVTNTRAYVANAKSNTLSAVDLSSDTVTRTYAVGSFPIAVALSPDGSTAYVTNFKGGSISIVSLGSGAVQNVPVGTDPDGVIQVGGSVYVSNLLSGTISVVNPATGTVTTTIALPGTSPAPSGLAASSNGHTLYVDDSANGTTDPIDIGGAAPALGGSVGVGTYPAYLAVDGATAYVANATQGGGTPGSVSVLDLTNPLVPAATKTIPVGAHPYGIALDAPLGEALVTNSGDDTLDVLDEASGTILATAPTGATPDAVAVTPDGRTAVISNEGDGTVDVIAVNALARVDDQTSGATASQTNSQNYEPLYASYDDQTADDFQVTAPAPFAGWRITGVVADGSYANATPPGPADSFNVFVYTDTASHLPGTLVYSATNIAQIADDATGDVTLPLKPAATLAPGRYWVSVQANQSFEATGSWFWDDVAPQTLAPAAWEQPQDHSGLHCPTWAVRTSCVKAGPSGVPDQAFALIGGLTRTVSSAAIRPALSTAAVVPTATGGARHATLAVPQAARVVPAAATHRRRARELGFDRARHAGSLRRSRRRPHRH